MLKSHFNCIKLDSHWHGGNAGLSDTTTITNTTTTTATTTTTSSGSSADITISATTIVHERQSKMIKVESLEGCQQCAFRGW